MKAACVRILCMPIVPRSHSNKGFRSVNTILDHLVSWPKKQKAQTLHIDFILHHTEQTCIKETVQCRNVWKCEIKQKCNCDVSDGEPIKSFYVALRPKLYVVCNVNVFRISAHFCSEKYFLSGSITPIMKDILNQNL